MCSSTRVVCYIPRKSIMPSLARTIILKSSEKKKVSRHAAVDV